MRRGVLKLLAIGLLALLFVLAVTDATWPEGDMDHVSNEEVGTSLFGESGAEGYGLVKVMSLDIPLDGKGEPIKARVVG